MSKVTRRQKIHKITVKPVSNTLQDKTCKDREDPAAKIIDQLDLIKKIHNDRSGSFYYMVHAVERSSPLFSPYALKLVNYEEIGTSYMTISATGVTQFNCNDMLFTPIETWEKEYISYLKLKKIKVFKLYRKWKSFRTWRKWIICKKYTRAKNFLKNRLFTADPILGKAILKVKGMCCQFLDATLTDIPDLEEIMFFSFIELQLAKLEDLRDRLDELRELSLETVYKACLDTLKESGYDLENSYVDRSRLKKSKLKTLPGNVSKMSCLEQISKREKCHQLSRFIHTIDYIILSTKKELLVNTYTECLRFLCVRSECHLNDELPDLSKSQPQTPLFITDLIISPTSQLDFDPSEKTFNFTMNTLRQMWEENLIASKPFTMDPVLYQITKPVINNVVEDSIYNSPPELNEILKQDSIILEMKSSFKKIVDENFHNAMFYIERYQQIKNFYDEDVKFDEDIIRVNTKCDVFRQWCTRYKSEIEFINNVASSKTLGIFLIRLEKFKKTALEGPTNKIRLIEAVMPLIGKTEIEKILSEALEAVTYLESEPVTTDDYAAYIRFIDTAQQKVDYMETRLDYVKEVYDAMQEFQIPISSEDMANYLSLGTHFTNLRSAVDKKIEDRQKLISKFNSQLQKDVTMLTEKITTINEEVTQPWLIDINSNIEVCLETLNEFNNRLSEYTATIEEFRTYQKQFKTEITRFDILDHVMNEVRLRILLWDTSIMWTSNMMEWSKMDFEKFNMEEVTSTTMQALKNIAQLEKGLPRNNVLPKLKEEVTLIKDKLPILSCLKNDNLKQRHWERIEAMLNYQFKPDEVVTLNLLESLNVFSYPNELMEIAATASSEAGLEMMLKKVEDLWRDLEFVIVPYKDSKDVFILGTVEEIQTAIDESNICIQTISASRYVEPIKPKVDEWIEKLSLFSSTLDEWLYCQQQWIYLEAIFSAPDIQRQLPIEAKLYFLVDKAWKEIMRVSVKNPLAMEICNRDGLIEQLQENNRNLDQIMKCLESYLETKRIAFPRFFFLSNEELLEILAQTKNPHAVQRHLQKCFDAIFRLEFASMKKGESDQKGTTIMTNDILAMISPEGERVGLEKGLKARGNVEDWLGKVEDAMFISLRKKMKAAISDLEARGRELFLSSHPSQVVLTVSQIFWVRNVHLILDSPSAAKSMMSFEQKCYSDLNLLAAMVRGELPILVRDVIINVITVDVHNRDIISLMVQNSVVSSTSFDWTKNLRYYWDENTDNCVARMSNSEYSYGYEYLGASKRLVITPLTDKCYLCLMGALQLDLGGAPAGPAGTGKTETTKDLAKALAIQCVVFNCSEGLDYKLMGRFFSGLVTSGAWCCFDEFNRIDIEVLSVIAQQLMTIRNAKLARAAEFMFEGRMIKLVMSCSTFITMNPGYAGRTELPDNLKSLFRPFAMMVPNYKLIAEITLYSEGFESSKSLSEKMTLLYTLCSEQLSQQDHYDFGMRAVKSVLVMAGSLKRSEPDKKEDVVLIKALRDSNIPKFLADDAELFRGIVEDLFPDIDIPVEDYGVFGETITTILEENGYQPEKCTCTKVVQLHETMRVRHGVMLVGPTGSGKTVVLKTLCDTYTRLAEMKVSNPCYKEVHMYLINPKSVTLGQLYGEVDLQTNEWHDGLIGVMTRIACGFTTDDHQWIVCDGPVDAVWIENLNTVLDDNKMLCLANSERIKLTPYVHMVFEVQDLAVASPATVSRCGMVYVDPTELKWLPYVKSWSEKLSPEIANSEIKTIIVDLFEEHFEKGLNFFAKNCDTAINQVDISKANMACAMMESILNELKATFVDARIKTFLTQAFIFSYLWSVGGNAVDASREAIELFIKNQFLDNAEARLPAGDLWNFYVNVQNKRLDLWVKIMPSFVYNKEVPFFDIQVPTIDTVRYSYIMKKLLDINKPVLFTGATGVGKSVITKNVMNELRDTDQWVSINMVFSAQTSSSRIQEILELKFEKRKKTLLGAPIGKRICVFVDDINMPKLEVFGAQPPVELLRQILDFGGLYDTKKLFWKDIVDVTWAAACAPPGGGRNPVTPRFFRHFAMLLIPDPTAVTLKTIFRAVMRGFLQEFSQPIIDIGDKLVNITVDLYNKIAEDLLPTPEKSHYVFNLRDLSKCFQGIMQVDSSIVTEVDQMLRLFYHECLRVFHDRLINEEDKNYFNQLLTSLCIRTFENPVVSIGGENENKQINLFFGDFLLFGAPKETRFYQEMSDKKIKEILQDYLEDYNFTTAKEMSIIFFQDAIEHICRLARILRTERGNGLLVGVGGMGKQSLTKLSSHINGYKCYQIEVSRSYNKASWDEDLRRFYFRPGAFAENTTFLFTDTQIILEEFLEDINNTLNTGEIPNLYESDELEKVIIATRPAAKEAGIPENDRDGIFQFFIERVRNYLHLMICMSPIGDTFRHRCRMFPSLVNCCTIDWFLKWPDDALLSVANSIIISMVPNDETKLHALSSICVSMHQGVEKATIKFFEEMRRRYYTTPSSYLQLLKLYRNLYDVKKNRIILFKKKISNGLQKLYDTNETIAEMKKQLLILAPKLKISSEEVTKLLEIVTVEQQECDIVRNVVSRDEAAAKIKAAETSALEEDARKDLELAMPALLEAQKALEALNKNDINEIKVFNQPPHLVRFVMEAVNLLLGEKLDWKTAKLVLGDIHFLDRLLEYAKDEISDKLLEKLQHYVKHPDFVPDIIARQSKVCKSICIWVRAIDGYAKIYRVVEPKRQKLVKAQHELWAIEEILATKQMQLREVEEKIKKLEEQYNSALANLTELQNQMTTAEARIRRSGQLTSALRDEGVRWTKLMTESDEFISNLIGDMLIASGVLAYLGAFTSSYRNELIENWLDLCKEKEINTTANYNITTCLANAYEIRTWNVFGLPTDQVSIENAILVTHAANWPLMIDPQEQADRWIRNMEQNNNLRICKITDSNFLRTIETCITIGAPVLLREVGEVLDPCLEPILLKQIFIQAGRTLIKLGDTDVEYDHNFKLYITTKLSNPHYLPEVCIKVTIINFTVTPRGLEDQLLENVTRLERPDLAEQLNELIVKINADKLQLQEIEDKILALLYSAGDDILDNEELIETLGNSKETSSVIATRLIETEITEKKIMIAREKYRSVARRGSVIYFVISSLADIDPMYQFSLKYFIQIHDAVIEISEKNSDLDKRLNILINQITLVIFVNVSRGLFERHKLIFSFMLNISIFLDSKVISKNEWNYLLYGPGPTEMDKKPDIPTLTNPMWESANYIANNFLKFKNILQDLFKKISLTIGYFSVQINVVPSNNEPTTTQWDMKLSDIEKLMLIKSLKEEQLLSAIVAYVSKNLGKSFVESPLTSIQNIYADISNQIPLVFILTTGSDPFAAFQRFAFDKGFHLRYDSISLGQGQGPIAEKLLRNGVAEGRWIFLQNCHLAISWMLRMESLVTEIIDQPKGVVHDDFRLFLSSMPSPGFPISVLQSSVKVTNEPPKGLKANMKRAFHEISEEFFEDHEFGQDWRKIVFGICFFHGIIQERKKFGPLGWNILYEFTDSDRECCLLNLEVFCEANIIPWDALIYTTGEITYGGRVTDNWDLRCLKTILGQFFSPKTLDPDYVYCASGTYYCPPIDTLQEIKEFIETFPIVEEPEIFGMHENANIAFLTKETRLIVETVKDVQPKEAITSEGESSADIVFEMADMIINRIRVDIDIETCHASHMKRDLKGRIPPLTTVILHEVDRYNKLLQCIYTSMENLQRAIKGFVVMSEELENVFSSLMKNQVPQIWHNVNVYPSLKTLGSWIRNLEHRIDFIVTWLQSSKPISFWISGLSFPQGFLTGVQQTFARKYNIPINALKLDFITTSIVLDQNKIEELHIKHGNEVKEAYNGLTEPIDGVYIHGLFLDSCKWDFKFMILIDASTGEINPPFPVLHINPVLKLPFDDPRYVCPLYKTAVRAGVLSTTGHSTNFVVSVLLPSTHNQSYWILKGAALLIEIIE